MKTTTQQAAINRLNKVANKSTKAYQMILAAIENKSKVIRPVYTLGSGKYVSNQNHTAICTSYLKSIGIEYYIGNDAPRGGEIGTFIKLVTKIK